MGKKYVFYPGDNLEQILSTAEDGISRKEINKKYGEIGLIFLDLLLRHDLLQRLETDEIESFLSTEFYRSLDKETLPYAFDMYLRDNPGKIDTNTIMSRKMRELHFLRKSGTPSTLSQVVYSYGSNVKGWESVVQNLTKKGRIENIDGGKYKKYQRSGRGLYFLKKVYSTIEALKTKENAGYGLSAYADQEAAMKQIA